MGNLPPQKEVIITITYVMELVVAEDAIKFSLYANTKAFPDGKNVKQYVFQ